VIIQAGITTNPPLDGDGNGVEEEARLPLRLGEVRDAAEEGATTLLGRNPSSFGHFVASEFRCRSADLTTEDVSSLGLTRRQVDSLRVFILVVKAAKG